MNKKLGKLKKINDLREIWEHEAKDFTGWLALSNNLLLLSDEIGIDIKLIQTEAPTGKFNVDILAEEENTGKKIVIENQLEFTDHDHLGKLLTYASGHDAEIIIWIVKNVRDEHKQAIDWLNEHTDEKINLFVIKIELWQIDESSVAPKFQVVSEPNDWAKTIKRSNGQSAITETKLQQLEFWNKFKEYAQFKSTKLRLRKAHPQHWYDIRIGNADAHISLTVNTQQDLLGCELYVPNSKELFNGLEKNKDDIEKELNEKLEWMGLPEKKASRIKITTSAILDNIDDWQQHFEWLVMKAEHFQKIFLKYIGKLR